MKKISKKSKKILASVLLTIPPISLASGLGWYTANEINTINEYNNFISTEINNFDVKVNDNFIKGADISSYADVIENLLFQNNIKDSNGNWYTYKDFENPNIKVWDKFQNKNVTLEEYVNNNLYSYFNDDGNRIYSNLFVILKNKGFNSLRLKLWVDPYDENGNSYGGGHNDLDTDIFILKQAKKYGFNDFLLDFHYSDFWADPSKQYLPKSWRNLSEYEIIQKGYDYTYETLDKIYKETGIIINRIQYGNEIDKGFLWNLDKNNNFIKPNYKFLNKFILSAVKATEDFNLIHNDIKIEKSIHFGTGGRKLKFAKLYNDAIKKMDTILLSSYILYGATFNSEYDAITEIAANYPDKKIVLGEIAIHNNWEVSEYINDSTENPYNFSWTPEIQALITNQYMQFLSKLFPNIETGMYWWEIGQLYLGRLSWASSSGIKFFKANDYKSWKDLNNWSKMTCFDNNGIALPSLDTIGNFKRNIDIDIYNVFSPKEYFKFDQNNSYNKKTTMFYEKINFIWPNTFKKQDISKIFFDKNNISINDKDIHIEIYLNNKNISLNDLKNKLINQIKKEFKSIMYNQITFDDFEFDSKTNLGSISLFANSDSFYYKNPENNLGVKLKFKVYNEYLSNTIDLSNNVISISKTDKNWYSKIINELKSQPDWAFGNQIWKYLNISGGANDNNEIWLYDNNKNVNRNAEFFLLKNDQIRLLDNTVDYDILNNNKFWINNFSNYNLGNNEIYFAIRKGINDINLSYNIPSTFSLVGKESWKYIDLLIYKLSINLY